MILVIYGRMGVSEGDKRMKLIVAIVSNDDSHPTSQALIKHNFSVTKLSTTGGFLRAGNTTLLIGCEDNLVDKALEILKEYSSERTEMMPNTIGYDVGTFASMPIQVQVGGVTVFVLDVDQFYKL